jgi:hypothetical protein
MSRIGKKAIVVPSGVNIEIDGLSVRVKGPKGLLERQFHPRMKIVKEMNEIKVVPQGETKLDKSLHGLTRTLIANMVHGVSDGFEKSLELVGVGFILFGFFHFFLIKRMFANPYYSNQYSFIHFIAYNFTCESFSVSHLI